MYAVFSPGKLPRAPAIHPHGAGSDGNVACFCFNNLQPASERRCEAHDWLEEVYHHLLPTRNIQTTNHLQYIEYDFKHVY